MSTPVTNFGKVTVSTGYDAAATSLVLTTGHGSRLPSTFPFPLTWWDATTYSDAADDPQREIVIVTTRTGDTLTVTRGAEGTSASTKNTGGKTYKMLLGITAAMWNEVQQLALSEDFRGLILQTHPDSDKAAAQVRLIHAPAIVMDDGEEVTGWDDLDLSMAVSGIGGIDQGSEQNSTWYQVIAGRNPVSGAKGIYAHRAKNYFLDETSTAGEDASQGLRSNVDNSTVKVAQGFKVDVAGPVQFIDVRLLKTGTPTGNYWFTIEANNGGVPSNTPLATSDKLDASRLLTSATWVRIPFRTPASLSAATQYHLVLQGDFAVSGTNYINWRMDGSAGAYANGSKALYDSDTGTWTTDTDDDMMLSLYVTENDTALVKPSGYTQAAHIGWVYNDSGGNLIPFIQTQRTWQRMKLADALAVNELAAANTLYDLRAFLPPVESLEVTVALTATGAAPSVASCGDVKATDLSASSEVGAQLCLRHDGTAEVPSSQGQLTLTASAIMVDATAGADFYLTRFRW